MVLDNSNVNTTRFTLVIPMDLSIKLDIAREKVKLNKSNWIIEAIREKLGAENKSKNYIEEMRDDIKHIKELLEK